MPISNLLDITEKGAPRILELWQESVLLQLKANTPKLTGTLAKALFVKHPIVKTGSGFVTGLGDKKMIGVDPFEKPPPNTISRFLDWWRDTPEGIQEAKERQQKRDDRATKSARSEIDRMTAKAEQEMKRQHFATQDEIKRRIDKLQREEKSMRKAPGPKGFTVYGARGAAERAQLWRQNLEDAEIGIKRESYLFPRKPVAPTHPVLRELREGELDASYAQYTQQYAAQKEAYQAKLASYKQSYAKYKKAYSRQHRKIAALKGRQATALRNIEKYDRIVKAAERRSDYIASRIKRLERIRNRYSKMYTLYWQEKRKKP